MSGLAFDGFKVMAKVNSWRIDGFAMRPDLDKPGFFDNAPDHQSAFGGYMRPGHCPRKFLSRRITWDWTANVHSFQRGTDRAPSHSRRKVVAADRDERPDWDFDYEALWQFRNIRRGQYPRMTVASETGLSGFQR